MTTRKPRPVKKCRHCGQLYQNLARHHAYEHPEIPFEHENECMKCEACGLKFDNARSHRRHMETVCGKREDPKVGINSETPQLLSPVMKCDMCGMKFERLRNLRRHTSRNNCFQKLPRLKGKEIFPCLEPKCRMEFYRKSDLDLHHAEKHLDSDTERTRANDYDTNDAANGDEDGEEETSPFQCSFCPKICQGFGHKSRHERTHLTKYKCKVLNCDASFSVLGKFLGHMEKFHDVILADEDEVERYMNTESGIDENKPANNISEDEAPMQMKLEIGDDEIMPKLFKGKKNMRERRARNGEKPPFKCQYCPKTYGKFSHRNRHELSHSENPKPYKCEIDDCTMTFSRRENYRRHLNSHVPEELRPKLPCPYENCSEEFISVKALKSHKALHENGLMYSCKMCMRSFGKKWKLNRHLSEAHGHLKPFACSFKDCSHRFVRKAQVQAHIRKQHILHYCFEAECGSIQPFGTRGEMYKHNKKFHPAPKQNLVCGDCGRVCYSKSGFSRHQLWHQKVMRKEEQIAEEEIFACDYPFCAAVCSTKQELSAHIGEKHLGVHGNRKKKNMDSSCRICNGSFENDAALAQHLSDEHGISDETTKNSIFNAEKEKERTVKKARTVSPIPSKEQLVCEDEEEELYEEDVGVHMDSSEEDIDIVYMATSDVEEETGSNFGDEDEDEENVEQQAGAFSGIQASTTTIPRNVNENVFFTQAGLPKESPIADTPNPMMAPSPQYNAVPSHGLFPSCASLLAEPSCAHESLFPASSASLLLPPMHELFPASATALGANGTGFLSSGALDALLS